MSDVSSFLENYSMDITNRYGNTNKTQDTTSTDSLNGNDRKDATSTRDPSNTLTFEDMLMLMVTQLQNQTIDNTADTNEMMNQIIQMTVMQSLTELTQQVEEMTLANVMNYSASLVGQYVTLGVYDEQGNVQELYGQVEASGTYDGQQVIFVDGQSYFLSSIMAVGKLPPTKDPEITETPDESNGGNTGTGNGGTEAAGDTDNKVNGTEGI